MKKGFERIIERILKNGKTGERSAVLKNAEQPILKSFLLRKKSERIPETRSE